MQQRAWPSYAVFSVGGPALVNRRDGHAPIQLREDAAAAAQQVLAGLEQLLITLGTMIPGVKPIVMCAIPGLRLDDPALRGTRELSAAMWALARALDG